MDTQHRDLTFNVAQLLKESVGSTRKLDIGTDVLSLGTQDDATDGSAPLEARDVQARSK